MRSPRSHLSAAVGVLILWSLCGCAGQTILLYSVSTDPNESGRQWVWPLFLDKKPTVIAFWNTNEMQCLRDIPALKSLDKRPGSVQLVTVVTGRERFEIEKWLHREKIDYVVLLDLEEELAGRLKVNEYPAFLYFDTEGKEVGRDTDIRLVHNWFDRPRWLEKSGAATPASGRLAPSE
jgi:thiol-disulfide isomerase/thioredoxin